MAYSLLFDDQVYDWFKKGKLPPKHFRQIVMKTLELSMTPRPQDCIALKGGYRVDSGEYRIYYQLDDNDKVVHILLGKHRKDFYRELERLYG